MVYLTGDTHGELDRFKHGRLRWLGKRDIVVVLGDFGFVWDGSKEEQKKLDWLRKRPIPCFSLMVPTRITTCWPSTPSRSGLAAGSRLWAAMCTMSAVAACWSWRERNISVSAAPRVPTRKSGRPDTTGGRRRCPAMRNTQPVRPISKQTAGR